MFLLGSKFRMLPKEYTNEKHLRRFPRGEVVNEESQKKKTVQTKP